MSTTAPAHESRIWIEGHVFNKWTGVPLSGAWVRLRERQAGVVEPRVIARAGESMTDSNGFYSIDIDPGTLEGRLLTLSVLCASLRSKGEPALEEAHSHFMPRGGTLRRDLYVNGSKNQSFDTCITSHVDLAPPK